mgnify:CR=1 FL=1
METNKWKPAPDKASVREEPKRTWQLRPYVSYVLRRFFLCSASAAIVPVDQRILAHAHFEIAASEILQELEQVCQSRSLAGECMHSIFNDAGAVQRRLAVPTPCQPLAAPPPPTHTHTRFRADCAATSNRTERSYDEVWHRRREGSSPAASDAGASA